MTTKIEWVKNQDGSQGKTWNPVTGCSKISPGCQNCYAERMSKRLAGRYGYDKENPFKVTLHPDRIGEPLKWRKPQMVFVCSMGDLFHEGCVFYRYADIFRVMAACQRHTFLLLTKRPANMFNVLRALCNVGAGLWPLPNVWVGVTAENQEMADERIPILLQIPAAVRFVSVEPMLGDIDISEWLEQWQCQECGVWESHERFCATCTADRWDYDNIKNRGLGWCIVGGETGPKARPMHPDWVRSLRDQCQLAGVPFFFKSWGEWVCRPWSSDNGRKRELCLGMDGTSVYAQVGHMMGFRKPGEALMVRVGKKAAGRLLDGRTWDEMPEAIKS